MTTHRFPALPATILKALLDDDIAEQLLAELEISFGRVRNERGWLIAQIYAWREVLGPSLFRIRKMTRNGQASANWIQMRNLRYVIRTIIRSPGYSFAIITTLALGLGMATTAWTIVDRVLLSPPEYAIRGGELQVLTWGDEDRTFNAFSAADYVDLVADATSFDELHAYSPRSFTVTIGDESASISGLTLSGGMLDFMGAVPQLGRFITSDDDNREVAKVVVLSDSYWRNQFNGDPEVIGQSMLINGAPHEIVGVAPEWLRFRAPGEPTLSPAPTDRSEIFVANAFAAWRLRFRPAFSYNLIGRLAGGVTAEQAGSEIQALIARSNHDQPVTVTPLAESLVSYTRGPIGLLAGAVTLVLILSVANAVNLVGVRSVNRARERAVRAALGSSKMQALMLSLSENGILVLVASGLGILLSEWALASRMILLALPTLDTTPTFLSALTGAIAVGLIATISLTAAAMTGSSGNVSAILRTGGPLKQGRKHIRAQRWLIAVQAGLAVVVLAGAITIARSISHLQDIDLGIQRSNVLTMRMDLPEELEDVERLSGFLANAVAQVEAVPGVASAGFIDYLPYRTYGSLSGPLDADGNRVDQVFRKVASRGLFEALGIRLLHGRGFSESDGADMQPVAVLSRSLAVALFGQEDVVGRTVRSADGDPLQVVGVSDDVRPERPNTPAEPTMYLSAYQSDETELSLVLRGQVAGLLPEVRQVIKDLNSTIPVYDVATMTALVNESIGRERLVASLLRAFAVVSLLIGILGIYSTMSFAVAERRTEYGMRVALGSSSARLLRTVLQESVITTTLGIAVGLAGYMLFSGVLASYLYEVEPVNLLSVLLASVSMVGLATLGSAIPAWRASKVDPMTALRES